MTEYGRTVPWRTVAAELFDTVVCAVAFIMVFSVLCLVLFVWITVLRRPWPGWLREGQREHDLQEFM